MTEVLFKDEVVDKVKDSEEFHEFCRRFKCDECPFSGMHDCEYTFDTIKKELDK